MFKIADISPQIEFGDNAYKKLGELFSSLGNKAGIITSARERNTGNLKKISNTLKLKGVHYITFDRIRQNFNEETIISCVKEFHTLKPSALIALGDFNERMCARAAAAHLKLPCIEIPTVFNNPLLLRKQVLHTDRIYKNTELNELPESTIKNIILDYSLYTEDTAKETVLRIAELMLYTEEIAASFNCTFYTRILTDKVRSLLVEALESPGEEINRKNLYQAGLISAAASSSASKEPHKLSFFCRSLTRRFNIPLYAPFTIVLPWFLEQEKRGELAEKIRPLFAAYNLPVRFKDLGLELSQIETLLTPGDFILKEIITGAY